jgi:hypothetical protein
MKPPEILQCVKCARVIARIEQDDDGRRLHVYPPGMKISPILPIENCRGELICACGRRTEFDLRLVGYVPKSERGKSNPPNIELN